MYAYAPEQQIDVVPSPNTEYEAMVRFEELQTDIFQASLFFLWVREKTKHIHVL